MKIRFGFVAMSLTLVKASPSQTMTVSNFSRLRDQEAALRRITNIASLNLANTLRILRHANSSGVHLYRFTSKLIPLFGHPVTGEWDFFRYLKADLKEIGNFVRTNGMRVSFHPDHYTLLNSPKEEVLINSLKDLQGHHQLLEAMALDDRAKLVMHIGGGYKDKGQSLARFVENWSKVPETIRRRIILENDDKTYTAAETLRLCQELEVPMVLDLHHHHCNNDGCQLVDLIEPVAKSWTNTGLVPKIHISSSKSDKEFRHHAETINPADLIPYLELYRELDNDLDIMVEAKNKDEALFKLVRDLALFEGFQQINEGSLIYKP